MHHAVLAATAAQRMLPSRPPIVWNIRHSLSDISHEKPMTRAVLRLCAKLSRIPSAIIYNSHVAARQYEAFGFPADRKSVVKGKSVSVSVDPGGRRILKKKKKNK